MTVLAEKYTASSMPRLSRLSTVATDKSVSPPQALQVALAVFLISEELVKLGEISRIIKTRPRHQGFAIRHISSCLNAPVRTADPETIGLDNAQ
jgi:hypothetical protein